MLMKIPDYPCSSASHFLLIRRLFGEHFKKAYMVDNEDMLSQLVYADQRLP